MDRPIAPQTTGADAVFRLRAPDVQALPLVLASPHSGRGYSAAFLSASRLDALTLRRSEDCYVEEIFAAAAEALAVPLLEALFPRAYIDPNREPYEIDPAMFDGPLPGYVNARSPRVAVGLGTIARVVAGGEEIYRNKLRFADASARIEHCYYPYHAALRRLVDATVARFGCCILLDCHSMPSIGLPPDMAHSRRCDVVLGDCHGTACAGSVTDAAETVLRDLGYVTARNSPYAGGYTTRHYGRPTEGVHALQIELNRALYVDETTLERQPYLTTLGQHMRLLVAALGDLPRHRRLARR